MQSYILGIARSSLTFITFWGFLNIYFYLYLPLILVKHLFMFIFQIAVN